MALVAAQAYLLGSGAVPSSNSSSEDLSTLLMQRARKRAGRYWTPGRQLRKPWPNGKSLEPAGAHKMVSNHWVVTVLELPENVLLGSAIPSLCSWETKASKGLRSAQDLLETQKG